ncbi:MAG: hypothetical protein UFJ18_16325, partial [Blautia sp.]|nr:hypothetical protein [Blautia sp.]
DENKIYSIGFAANFERFVKLFLTKRWGILIKKESTSLDFIGLKIPRDYLKKKEVYKTYEAGKTTGSRSDALWCHRTYHCGT